MTDGWQNLFYELPVSRQLSRHSPTRWLILYFRIIAILAWAPAAFIAFTCAISQYLMYFPNYFKQPSDNDIYRAILPP